MSKLAVDQAKPVPCQCADPGCPGNLQSGVRKCIRDSVATLHRIDMHDLDGTRFCESCGRDALSSGVFTAKFDGEEPEEVELD